jgi:hypothetical protein
MTRCIHFYFIFPPLFRLLYLSNVSGTKLRNESLLSRLAQVSTKLVDQLSKSPSLPGTLTSSRYRITESIFPLSLLLVCTHAGTTTLKRKVFCAMQKVSSLRNFPPKP